MSRFAALRARMSRLRWWHGGLAVLLCAALLAAVVFLFPDRDPDVEPDPPEEAPRALVSVGDSTLSGEGTGNYVAGTDGQDGNLCRRSPDAAIHQTAVPGVDETINLACSGARAEHVQLGEVDGAAEPSQAEQLAEITETHRVVAVVVAIGANDDPRFLDTIRDCIRAWFGGAPCSETVGAELGERVEAMAPKVTEALADVREVLDDAGYEPEDYELILQSYASPLSPEIPENLRNLNGCPFTTEDLEWIRAEGAVQLTDGLREAAREVDARFLDLSRAGRGREACTGGADASTEWFTRLAVQWESLEDVDRASGAFRESFHPNTAGHAQLGACLTQFLGSDSPESACLVTADGTLQAAPAVRPGS